jgi:SnoaL-like protein
MTPIETVQAVLGAIEASDWQRARSLLADDFTLGGPTSQPIGPDAFLGIHRAFAAAMPDFSFNAGNFHEANGTVTYQVRITGTQTHDLVLPVPGIAPIPATGKRVSLPAEPNRVTLRGDKVATAESSEVPGGGLAGLLAQLGVSLPTHN